ncbi:hypothetical protein TRVL_09825 [Trypanosoma vivax]|nr:hypothetical protein TRVL_09825 [Trypanosoma vivax]
MLPHKWRFLFCFMCVSSSVVMLARIGAFPWERLPFPSPRVLRNPHLHRSSRVTQLFINVRCACGVCFALTSLVLDHFSVFAVLCAYLEVNISQPWSEATLGKIVAF